MAKIIITFDHLGKINSLYFFVKVKINAARTIIKLLKNKNNSGVSRILIVPLTLSACPKYLIAENWRKL